MQIRNRCVLVSLVLFSTACSSPAEHAAGTATPSSVGASVTTNGAPPGPATSTEAVSTPSTAVDETAFVLAALSKEQSALGDLATADDANTDTFYDGLGLRDKLGVRADAVYAALQAGRRTAFAHVAVPDLVLPVDPSTTGTTDLPSDSSTPSNLVTATTSRRLSGRATASVGDGGLVQQFLAATFGLQFSVMFAGALEPLTSDPGGSGELSTDIGDKNPPPPQDDGKETTTTSFHETATVGGFGSVVTMKLDGEVDQTVVDDKTQATISQLIDTRSYSGRIDVCPNAAGQFPASMTATVRIAGTGDQILDVHQMTFSGSVNDSAALTSVKVDSDDSSKWKTSTRQGSLDQKLDGLSIGGSAKDGLSLSNEWDSTGATLAQDGTGDAGREDVDRAAGRAG